MRVAGRQLALVTGATRGIGAAIGEALTSRRFKVFGTARDVAPLTSEGEPFDNPEEISLVAVDLSRPADTFETVRGFLADVGVPDVVVHCAGVGYFGPIAEITPEQWTEMINVNLGVGYILCHEVLPLMAERGSGHFIAISSALEAKSSANTAAYAATKHALKGLYEGVASEYRRSGVRVSRVVPSSVKTAFAGFSPDDKAQALEPHDVAEAVVRILELGDSVSSAVLELEGATIFEPFSARNDAER